MMTSASAALGRAYARTRFFALPEGRRGGRLFSSGGAELQAVIAGARSARAFEDAAREEWAKLKKDGKKFWLRIGAAFQNNDGSLNVRLDALPTNGTLHIRDSFPGEKP